LSVFVVTAEGSPSPAAELALSALLPLSLPPPPPPLLLLLLLLLLLVASPVLLASRRAFFLVGVFVSVFLDLENEGDVR
jgi:hypothetical protein